MSDEVEITVGPLRGPTWSTYGKDFANMLKAFIGSNYLTISFAFHMSGLGLGLAGVVLIASLTAHCCNLIVKCKYHAVRLLLQDLRDKANTQRGRQCHGADSPSTSTEDGSEEVTPEDNDSDAQKQLLRGLSYGDIGRLCFGSLGVVMVNVPVLITQFGFCVGYCIFVGNTIQSMFPLYNCSMPVTNASAFSQIGDPQTCFRVNSLNSLKTTPVNMSNLTEVVPGVLHGVENLISPYDLYRFTPTTQASDMSTIPLWLLGNSSTTTEVSNITTTAISNVTATTAVSNLTTTTAISNITTTAISNITTTAVSNLTTTTAISNITTTAVSNLTTTTLSPNVTTSMPIVNTTISIPWSNMSVWTLTRGKHVPDLKLLVLTPVPFFILTTLIRSLRRMGWISMMANAAIMVGCGEVLYFLISGFYVSDSFRWINWMGIPVFFGLVTSSFEGIGTILPIEGSMEGNRHNFTKYLYGAVAVLGSILICFGTLGYMHFGDSVEQMVNANIPSGDALNIFVNVSLCIGVLLTFPLMMFPVVELAEMFFFSNGCCKAEDGEESENRHLLPKAEEEDPRAKSKNSPSNVAGWKRNILRTMIVLCAAAFAVLLRNYFAYISAFVGALGSTMLAYILPCLFHLKLCWSRLPLPIKIKDIVIIIIGVSLGIAGVYSVIREIVG